MLWVDDALYLANQGGGSVTTVGVSVTQTGAELVNPRNLASEMGTRALAFDARDNLVLALNQGAGSITLIDRATGASVGRIDAVRSPGSENDDHSDRLQAPNRPAVATMFPQMVRADTTFLLQLTGKNLMGATALLLLDPESLPGLVQGNGTANRGVFGTTDPGITVSEITPSPDGAQLMARVHVVRGHATAPRILRVLTPNGETTLDGALAIAIRQ